MKKCFFFTMFWVLILALTPWHAQAQTISELLPLDGLNLFVHTDNDTPGCTVSYDPLTQTITYDYPGPESSYGYAGWDFRGGTMLDLSAFSSLVLHVAETSIDPAGSIEFALKYASFPGDSKFERQNVGIGGSFTVTIPLDADAKNEVEYVYIKSANAGTLRIAEITATVEGMLELSFDDFHKEWKGDFTSYEYNNDLERYVIYFDDISRGQNWQPWGWGNEGRNFSEYDYVRIDFVGECEYDVTLQVNYNPESTYAASIATWPAGSTFAAVALNPDVPGEYVRTDNGELGGGVRDIVIYLEGGPSILVLDKAYLAKGEAPKPDVETEAPDLEVTNITWEPRILSEGAQLLFTATVLNSGTKATPNDTKHGVVFRVYAENDHENAIASTWSDNHRSSIAPGESVFCTATGSPGDGPPTWTYFAAGGPYYVRAQVNDTNDIPELNKSNNVSDFFLIENLSGIQSIAAQNGSAYVENGVLKLMGYSPSAVATVYNLQGQEQKNDQLNNNVYIVKVIDNACLSVHKVVAK